MTKQLLALGLFVTLLACNQKKEDEVKNNEEKNKITPVQSSFVIAPFKILDNNDSTGLELKNDGKVYAVGQMMGTLDTLGQMKSPDGKVMMYLKNDSLYSADRNYISKIGTDGAFSIDTVKMTWSGNGHLLKGSEDIGFKLAPPDTKAKQAASMIFLSYFSFDASGKQLKMKK